MAKKKAASASRGRSTGPANPEDTQRLHQFFRGLYEDPDKADQFNGGPKARQKLLDASDLSAAHKKLIKRGCIPDVIHALVGAPAIAAAYTSMVDCQDGLACNHLECRALTEAARPAAAKRTAAKRTAAPAAKKRR